LQQFALLQTRAQSVTKSVFGNHSQPAFRVALFCDSELPQETLGKTLGTLTSPLTFVILKRESFSVVNFGLPNRWKISHPQTKFLWNKHFGENKERMLGTWKAN